MYALMYALNHALERFFGDSVRVLTYSSYTVRHASCLHKPRTYVAEPTTKIIKTHWHKINAIIYRTKSYLEFLLRSTGALFTASLQDTTRVASIAYHEVHLRSTGDGGCRRSRRRQQWRSELRCLRLVRRRPETMSTTDSYVANANAKQSWGSCFDDTSTNVDS